MEDVRIVVIRFIWMPGKRPVKVPKRRPKIKAIVISIIIFYIFWELLKPNTISLKTTIN